MPTKSDLSPFFSPRTIAVVGVSRSPHKIGRIVFDNLTASSTVGKASIITGAQSASNLSQRIYAINPETPEIDNFKCYPRVSSIKDKIDLAVIAVPAQAVPSVVADCANAKVKAVIILTAGFSEIGNIAGERAILRAKKSMLIIGPNTMGCYDAYSGLDTIFNPVHRQARPQAGKIAFISQSGALGAAVLDWCASERIGISKFISIGNRIDVDEIELLKYLANDKHTSAIALYLEGTKRGPALLQALKEVSKRKPVIILKAGRTPAGAQAVMSHTASLAGEPEVWHGALRQSNVIEARNLEELFDMAKALSEQPMITAHKRSYTDKIIRPCKSEKRTIHKIIGAKSASNSSRNASIAIITNGGGLGVLCADEIIEQKLSLAQPTKTTLNRIKSYIPKYATLGNPLDITADSTPEMYKLALESLLADKAVDAAIVITLFQVSTMEPKIVDIIAAATKFKKPIIVCAPGGEFTLMNRRMLEKAGIPTYPTPNRAVRAIAALFR